MNNKTILKLDENILYDLSKLDKMMHRKLNLTLTEPSNKLLYDDLEITLTNNKELIIEDNYYYMDKYGKYITKGHNNILEIVSIWIYQQYKNKKISKIDIINIKNKYKEGKYETNTCPNDYGYMFYNYMYYKFKLDTEDNYENDTFIINYFDWDGGDCTCGLENKADKLYNEIKEQTHSEKQAQKAYDKYLDIHMHEVDCGDESINFYHKATGFKFSYYKHLDWIEYMNYPITINEFKVILEDCWNSYKKRSID